MAESPRLSLRDIAAPPNLVTLVRIALVPVALVFLVRDERLWALAAMAVMFVSDGLDGYLARRLDRVTELGKVLDPAADKVAVAAVLLYLVVAGEFPLWALLLVVVRDVAIVLGGVAMTRRCSFVPQSLMVGKIAAVVLAFVVIVFVADLSALEPAALAFCVLAVVTSGTAYAVVARRSLSAAKRPRT